LKDEINTNTNDFIKVLNNLEHNLDTITVNNKYVDFIYDRKFENEDNVRGLNLNITKVVKEKCGKYQEYLVNNMGNLNYNNYDEIVKMKNEYIECQRKVKQSLLI
jgi:hypothetical protein